MNNFQYKMVPAGCWSQLAGTTPRGGDNEPRPHLIPTTDDGRRLLVIETSGFFGHTGLCPGEVTLDDGSKTLAYRFITLPDRDRIHLLDQLDEIVRQLRFDKDEIRVRQRPKE